MNNKLNSGRFFAPSASCQPSDGRLDLAASSGEVGTQSVFHADEAFIDFRTRQMLLWRQSIPWIIDGNVLGENTYSISDSEEHQLLR